MITNLIVLIANMAAYNLYVYELLWGSWDKREAKALYYLSTAIVMIYLLINDIRGKSCEQVCLINKSAIIVNFLLFAAILYDVLPTPYQIGYVITLNGSIFVISLIVLIQWQKHGLFNS